MTRSKAAAGLLVAALLLAGCSVTNSNAENARAEIISGCTNYLDGEYDLAFSDFSSAAQLDSGFLPVINYVAMLNTTDYSQATRWLMAFCANQRN